MKIGITSDHRGFQLKEKLIKYLNKKGYEVVDFGTNSKELVDYPRYAFILAESAVKKEIDLGIAICGTGIGMSIACNKVKGARCSKIDSVEEAKLTKTDNNPNVVALNGSMPSYKAYDIMDMFLKTEFSSIERYQNRIDQISEYESEITL